MSRASTFVITSLVLTGLGCAHHASTVAEPVRLPIHVEVNNRYALSMEIEVSGGGATYRLGLVEPGLTSTFVLPAAIVTLGSGEFIAHPTMSGPTFRSGTVQLAPGDMIDFHITPQLFNSTVIFRP